MHRLSRRLLESRVSESRCLGAWSTFQFLFCLADRAFPQHESVPSRYESSFATTQHHSIIGTSSSQRYSIMGCISSKEINKRLQEMQPAREQLDHAEDERARTGATAVATITVNTRLMQVARQEFLEAKEGR